MFAFSEKIMQRLLLGNIIKDMKKRIYKGSVKKLDKIENYRKHFGWVTQSREDKKLVMTYDTKQKNRYVLRNLEKQAEVMRSKFPFKMIPWLSLALIFLVCLVGYNDGVWFGIDLNEVVQNSLNHPMLTAVLVGLIPVVAIVGLGLNLFFAGYTVVVFIILKFAKHTTLEEIFRMADALSQNIIDAPLKGNIEPPTERSGVLAKMKIGSNNWNSNNNKSA